ncbi:MULTISPECIES: hypothetical protein [Streptomyces]|uniref:hypothetical protein n=1 Tax=Streptomyces TaxID=1883 RepID=UPI000996EAF1|nr:MULTISPECIES: hypothetical protein [Streptomyces]
MARLWEADPSALFAKRLGKSAAELGHSEGRDLTAVYASRLPTGVSIGPDERLVVIPGNMLSAAKVDIPDA